MHQRILLSALASGLLMAQGALAEVNVTGLANTCNNCHGTGGVSVGQSMPSIAGLPEAYLKNVLMEWKSGARASASMTRLISGYTDEEIAALAAYYSKLPWKPVDQKTDKAMVKKGKGAAGSCTGCHGDTGKGDDETPKLNGQWSKYMDLELMKYRDESFKMTHQKMRKAATKAGEVDGKAAVEFFASQKK